MSKLLHLGENAADHRGVERDVVRGLLHREPGHGPGDGVAEQLEHSAVRGCILHKDPAAHRDPVLADRPDPSPLGLLPDPEQLHGLDKDLGRVVPTRAERRWRGRWR